jgi:hypothetical protein
LESTEGTAETLVAADAKIKAENITYTPDLLSSITYETTIPPALVSGSMTLDSQALKYKSLEFDMGNQLADRVHVDEAGAALSCVIASRETTGTLDPEMLAVATYNFFTDMTGQGEGSFTLTDGAAAGNIVTITAPKGQYTAVEPGDRDGLQTAGLSLRLNISSGDDELVIANT